VQLSAGWDGECGMVPKSDSECGVVPESDSECGVLPDSDSERGVVPDSDGRCGTVLDNDSECGVVPESDSECGVVLDGASKHGMYSMGTIINYDLSDVTMTNYGKFLILLMYVYNTMLQSEFIEIVLSYQCLQRSTDLWLSLLCTIEKGAIYK